MMWIVFVKDVNLVNSIGIVVGVGKIGWVFVFIYFVLCLCSV